MKKKTTHVLTGPYFQVTENLKGLIILTFVLRQTFVHLTFLSAIMHFLKNKLPCTKISVFSPVFK